MKEKPKRALRLAISLALLGVLVFTGYTLHGRTDWAVAASPPISPSVVWGACLTSGKPAALEGLKPGIDPRSSLYYHPVVVEKNGERQHVGWRFYGEAENRLGKTIGFECTTDLLGKEVRWA